MADIADTIAVADGTISPLTASCLAVRSTLN